MGSQGIQFRSMVPLVSLCVRDCSLTSTYLDGVTQLVECLSVKQGVVGSSPATIARILPVRFATAEVSEVEALH